MDEDGRNATRSPFLTTIPWIHGQSAELSGTARRRSSFPSRNWKSADISNGVHMTCLQTCSYKRIPPIRGLRPWELPRFIKQSFADLWIAILHASLAGFAVLAIDASDGGIPSISMWILCAAAPPVTASLLIVVDAIVRTLRTGRTTS